VPRSRSRSTLFNNSYDKDKFRDTASTRNGKLGPRDACIAGPPRPSGQPVRDYTNDARAWNPITTSAGSRERFRLNSHATSPQRVTRLSPPARTERNEQADSNSREHPPERLAYSRHRRPFPRTNRLFDRPTGVTRPSRLPRTPLGTPGNGHTVACRTVGTLRHNVENPGVPRQCRLFRRYHASVKQTAFFGSSTST